jgi:uncharacterized protein (DUF433 family)
MASAKKKNTIHDFWSYLDSDSRVCHGQLCFKGTRIMVYQILDALAEGAKEDELLAVYPTLTREHLRAAIAFGADVARHESFLPLADGRTQ